MRRQRITITLKSDVINRIDRIIDGRKLRNRSQAIESILDEKLKSKISPLAIMLGGGQGIISEGEEISKLMAPLGGGQVLAEKNFDYLRDSGVRQVIVAAGEWERDIKKSLKHEAEYGIKICFRKGSEGTASPIRESEDLLTETFFMMNGDILLGGGIDLEDMYKFHRSHQGLATIALAGMDDPSALGSIRMKGSRVIDFIGKTTDPEKQTHLINAGLYFMEPGIAKYIPEGRAMLETDVFPRLAKLGKLYGYVLHGDWVHLDSEGHIKNHLAKNTAKSKLPN